MAILPKFVRVRCAMLIARRDEVDNFDFLLLLPMMSRRGLKLPREAAGGYDRGDGDARGGKIERAIYM